MMIVTLKTGVLAAENPALGSEEYISI